jgi:hypothetical protein
VRQRALRNADARKLARFRGIGNIDNGSAVRRLDVSDIRDAVADNDLSAAWAVEESDNLQTLRSCHCIVTPVEAMRIRIADNPSLA